MSVKPSKTAAAAKRRTAQLSDVEYAALGQFRWSMRQFLQFSEEGAREQGISSQQHQALLAIRSHPGPEPLTIGGLAERLFIKNHSALELVSRMAENGLVERAASNEDRRRVLLQALPREPAIVHDDCIVRRQGGRLVVGDNRVRGLACGLQGQSTIKPALGVNGSVLCAIHQTVSAGASTQTLPSPISICIVACWILKR